IESSIQENRRQGPASRDPSDNLEPARTKQIADTTRQDVVHCDAADHHLYEPCTGHLRCPGYRAPAHRLSGVHARHGPDRKQDESNISLTEHEPNLVEVGFSERQPEKDSG
ncbi:MAG: hypothetical protein M3546_09975, partial [Actinomycetota bacterium]|nr:hypothetical protein [Actinomycetota bacterium]